MNQKLDRQQDIHEMIAALYGAASGASAPERALEQIIRLTASDKAFIGSYDFKAQRGRIETSFNIEDHHISAYEASLSAANPWLRQPQFFQAEGLLWIGSEILPREQLLTTAFYELFLSPQAMLHTMHAVIRVVGDVVTHLVLTRTPDDDDYTTSELEICRLFAWHCANAMEAHEAVNAQYLVQKSLSELMEQRAMGVAVLDENGRTLFVNDVCHEILNSLGSNRRAISHRPNGNGHSRPFKRIEFPKQVFDKLHAPSPALPATVICEKEEGDYPIVFHLHRVEIHDSFSASDRAATTILALDPEKAVQLDADSICQAYHLTPSEARVSALIAIGERVEDAAALLGITPSTARTHLKRIFEKTRTSRQAELVKLLLDTARRRPIERHLMKRPGKGHADDPDDDPAQLFARRPTSPGAKWAS